MRRVEAIEIWTLKKNSSNLLGKSNFEVSGRAQTAKHY